MKNKYFAIPCLFLGLSLSANLYSAPSSPDSSSMDESQAVKKKSNDKPIKKIGRNLTSKGIEEKPNTIKEEKPNITEEKYDNYISISFGTAKVSVENSEAVFSKEYGKARDIEFFWANKNLGKIFGGIKSDQDNKIVGYYLNYMLSDRDIISIRTWNTNATMSLHDNTFDVNYYTMGKFDASKIELSYTYENSFEPGKYSAITYGKSNYPLVALCFSGHTYGDCYTGTNGSRTYSINDLNPDIQYLSYSVEQNPIRAALLKGEPISSQSGGSEDYYFAGKAGIGIEQVKFGSNLAGDASVFGCISPGSCFSTGGAYQTTNVNYDPKYGNNYVLDKNPGGVANSSALFLITPIYIETGWHFSKIKKHSQGPSIISTIGVYVSYELPLSGLALPAAWGNKIESAQWLPAPTLIYGGIARLSVLF